MATLYDVAKMAGVSTATVSKVLSETPYFTEATRHKVMQAVEELGYIPNLAARALSTGKSRVVAVVFPYVYDAIFEDPLVLSIIGGIEAVCRDYDYNLLLSTPRLTEKGGDQQYQQLISSGYLDGVIALDGLPAVSALGPVNRRGIPAVAIGYHETECYVRSDDASGGFQLMKHVLDLGHREIGIIAVPGEMHFSLRYRLDGLEAAAQEASLDFAALPIVYGDFSSASGAHAAATILAEHKGLTAIVALNDRMAMGAIQQARALGRRVPHDLTVVGYDDIPMAALFSPSLTTIDQQAPELGRAAAKSLFQLLGGDQPQPVHVSTLLVERDSSQPLA